MTDYQSTKGVELTFGKLSRISATNHLLSMQSPGSEPVSVSGTYFRNLEFTYTIIMSESRIHEDSHKPVIEGREQPVTDMNNEVHRIDIRI